MAIITRDELRLLLGDWQVGRRTSAEVHDWAEMRYAVDGWDCEDDVANVVLGELDRLDMNLLTNDDVPVLQAILDLPQGQQLRATEMMESHFAGISLDARKSALASDPTYAPFCRL